MWETLPPYLDSEERFLVDEKRLMDSYHCCESANVARDIRRSRNALASRKLKDFLVRHNGLITYTRLLFSDTHRYLSDPRQVFILTDDNAQVFDIYSRPEVLELFTKTTGLCPGASLREESCGTNAVTIALSCREESIIRGDQHFCRFFHSWNSIAVPVIDPTGKPTACVGIWTPCTAAPGEKLGMAKLMAKDLQCFLRMNCLNNAAAENTGKAPGSDRTQIRLTGRQQQVLCHFAKGLSYKEIAGKLGVNSVKTVEEHLDAVRTKLSATCRRECIQKAMDLGLL